MTREQFAARAKELMDDTAARRAVVPEGEGLERLRLMARADDLGIGLTAGDVANSRAMKQWEAGIESNPFLSGLFEPMRERNREVVNRLALRAIGEQAPAAGRAELSGSVFGRAHDRLGRVFSEIGDALDMNVETGELLSADGLLMRDLQRR
jgi:hypothetical protein